MSSCPKNPLCKKLIILVKKVLATKFVTFCYHVWQRLRPFELGYFFWSTFYHFERLAIFQDDLFICIKNAQIEPDLTVLTDHNLGQILYSRRLNFFHRIRISFIEFEFLNMCVSERKTERQSLLTHCRLPLKKKVAKIREKVFCCDLSMTCAENSIISFSLHFLSFVWRKIIKKILAMTIIKSNTFLESIL